MIFSKTMNERLIMDNLSYKSDKKLTIALLAHVDAGKTTMSEALLYTAGAIRRVGRVDNRDAYLDTNPIERERGITIFSKQAVMQVKDTRITLVDTPGHVDFGTETERVLPVIDAAVLLVSGVKGIQGHTKTLWRLLERYHIPVYIFVNKMDMAVSSHEALMDELKSKLSMNCIDFTVKKDKAFYEELALCDEALLESFIENGALAGESISDAIYARKVFPCFFGSALKLTGVRELIEFIEESARQPEYSEEFGARVFKITRDEQGSRITHLKVTGGTMRVKASVNPDMPEEKINQIRIYSGGRYSVTGEVDAGTVCAVTGLDFTRAGMGLGAEKDVIQPLLIPVLNYRMILPDGCDAMAILPKLKQLEDEDPQLHIIWDEQLQELHARVMGEIQLEVLERLISDRFGINVGFGSGSIIYKETIAGKVEGVGHFEPLRHYAEVHLILEPLPRGSGIEYDTDCSVDILDRNRQRLVIAMLREREHPGVLTGSAVTDIKITLVSGRAHQKHTEGGDFREAACRALRQGLKQAESVLLEPYYNFVLELPAAALGRALADMETLSAVFETEHNQERDGEAAAVIRGYAPVVTLQHYQREVAAYTQGNGRLELSFRGYERCHNAEEVISKAGYDSENDADNPTGSVFCAHGSGFIVRWDEVKNYMHMESVLDSSTDAASGTPSYTDPDNQALGGASGQDAPDIDDWISREEVEQIFAETFNRNKKDKAAGWNRYKKRRGSPASSSAGENAGRAAGATGNTASKNYLLVDGYNIIFAWQELKELAKVTVDGARGRLLDIMSNYQGIRGGELIVVFDAYRVEGHQTEEIDYHNIHVVYTAEAQTADQYIEKFAHDNGRKHNVTVATSDGLEQIIIRGEGCLLISAREFEEEVKSAQAKLREDFKLLP